MGKLCFICHNKFPKNSTKEITFILQELSFLKNKKWIFHYVTIYVLIKTKWILSRPFFLNDISKWCKDEILFVIFSEMTFFKTRFIIISKFNPVTLKTKNIDGTFSTCSKCLFWNESVFCKLAVLWTLCSPQVIMNIVCALYAILMFKLFEIKLL